MNRFSILFIITILTTILLAAPIAVAQDSEAGEENPTDEKSEDSPAVQEESFETPQLSGTLDQQIAQLSAYISNLQIKIDELVFAKESAERDRLKRHVSYLKRQLKHLLVKKQLASRSSIELGIENIRKNYASKISQIEIEKAATRRKTIQQFELLLERSQDSPSAANVIFKLGMLYFEDDHFNFQRQQEAYLSRVGDLINQGGDVEVGSEPKPDYSRAIERFRQATENYPRFQRADFAHYMLAYCLTEQEDFDEAIRIYQILIQKYPNSEFVPEAHIRIGELYFDENRMDDAINEYKLILKHPDSKFYDKALFKLGWSYYRLTASDAESLSTAIFYFTKLLAYYDMRPAASIRGGDDLRQESVDYIAISFTDMDERGYPAALQFIQKNKSSEWNKDLLAKMAEVYFERDRYDEAKQVIEERIKRWPDDPENPKIHLKIVDALVMLGRYDEAIAIGEQIAAQYGPNSKWVQANEEKKTVISKAQKQRAKLLFASATFHHENAQKTKKNQGMEAATPQFKKAANSYEQYLSSFPDAKDSYEATFNLAECYFELRQYDKASQNYEKVMAQRKDKDLFQNAVKNNVYAREQLFLANPGWPVKPPENIEVAESGKGSRVQIETIPLSQQAEDWVVAMKKYIELLPEDKDNARVMFKIGEVYFYHGQFGKAVEVLRQQIANYPNSEAAQVSMNLVIQALDRQGKYDELQVVAADYKNRVRVKVVDKDKNLTNIQVLDKIQVGATAKIAEQKIKEGKLQEGINEYITLANKNRNSEKAPIALHNAAATYIQMGKIAEANDVYLRIAREYPKFEKAKKNLYFAATQYEKLIDFDKAVETYQLYMKQYPNDQYAKDALYNAALLRENNKEYGAAVTLYREYLNRYPNSPDTAEVAFSIAKLQMESGNDSAAEMEFEQFTKSYNDGVLLTKAYLEWGKLAEKRGVIDEARRHYIQAAAVYSQSALIDPQAGAAYAAEAKFKLAEFAYQEFSAIQLTLPEKVMEKQLLAKADSYKNLNSLYKEIVQVANFEWATAALFMIGKINKDFAESLFSAPIPEGLSAEEQDIYIVKLEEMAFPLKKKSIEAFETNIGKGKDEKTKNKWINLSYDELKKYKPELVEEKYELLTSETATSIPSLDFTEKSSTAPPTPSDSNGEAN